MAKAPDFGVGQTDLGKSNFQAYVKQGIKDESKAMEIEADTQFLGTAGNLAIDTYVEYDKTKVLSGVAQQTGDIIREQQERSLEGQMAMQQEAMAIDQQLGDAKKGIGYDGTYPTMLNQKYTEETQGLVNSYAEKTGKLSKAREQGVMSEMEMEERLKKITREALSANPAYATEIMGHATKVAELHNLTGRIKQDDAIIKAQQESYDDYTKEIRKKALSKGFDIPIYSGAFKTEAGDTDYDAIEEAITRIAKLNNTNNMMDAVKGNNEKIGALKADALVARGGHFELIDAKIMKAKQKMNDILSQDIPVSRKQELIDSVLSGVETEVVSLMGLHNISTSDSDIKPALDTMKNRISNLATTYKGIADNSIDKTAAENTIQRLIADTKLDAYSKTPTLVQTEIALEAVSKLGPRIGYQAAAKLEKDILKGYTSSEGDMSDPESSGKYTKHFTETVPGTSKKVAAYAMEETLNKATSTGKPEDYALVEKEINKAIGYASNNPPAGAYAVQAVIKTMANPLALNAIDSFSGETESKILGVIKEYKTPLTNSVNAFKQANPEAKLSINPSSGKLILENVDAGTLSAFYKDHGRSIDETFKAYANVSGMSKSDAIDEFYADMGVLPEKK